MGGSDPSHVRNMKYSAQELSNISEVLTNFHWHIRFSGNPFFGFEDKLSMRAVAVTPPDRSHNKAEYQLLGLNMSHPGIFDPSGELTITFLEDIELQCIDCFDAWKKMYNEGSDQEDFTHVQTVEFNDLFATIDLDLMNKRDQVIRTIRYNYCELVNYSRGSELSDGSSPDYFRPTLNVRFAY